MIYRASRSIRQYILNDTNIMKKGYLWNSFASIITAMSSMGVLLIVTRFAGDSAGANLSIAIAIVNVLMNIGHMNIMGYQISDVNEKYVFNTYFRQRCYSIGVMVIIAFTISAVKYGMTGKSLIVVAYCVYKAINVFCELFQSRYQQKGRPDIASELNFMKVFFPDIFLCLIVILLKNLLLAILCASVLEIVILYVFNSIAWDNFASLKQETAKAVVSLTKDGFPLFVNAFSSTYILNSAKYAIDNNMPAESQLIYTILLLPATTVHMIAGFVYRPVLTVYAELWNGKKYKLLAAKVLKIIGIIMMCSLGGIIIRRGILSILSWAYGVKALEEYGTAFGILLMAGGVNALNVFLCYMITIVREQKYLYIINVVAFMISLVLPQILVQKNGINGAAFSYLLLMAVQFVGFVFCFTIVKHQINNQEI